MRAEAGLREDVKPDRDSTTSIRASLFLLHSPNEVMLVMVQCHSQCQSLLQCPVLAQWVYGGGHDAVDLDDQDTDGAGMVLDKMED